MRQGIEIVSAIWHHYLTSMSFFIELMGAILVAVVGEIQVRV
jgi:hypothetical protein